MASKSEALERAIEAVGGVAKLAEKIGISAPAISQWTRVPSERVIAVERATGVNRRDLRPDLYPLETDAAA